MSTNQLTITFSDGSTETVQTTLEDRLAFESALRKNRGWGKLEDNAMKMMPFLAWNAARRTGKTELSWAEFTSGDTAALSVEPPADEPEDADADLEVPGLGKDTPTEPSSSSPSSSRATTAARRGAGAAKTARD
ncbi:hypothetical protein BMH32_04690 [Leucobacter sp. OLJS4]|uniref:hypothetical protein n=1 Tax=unclassified Leucobacter TaxID=2621730 RepID=UPI000C17B394|nr:MULTISPECIES: hypothetical protein [unclassified Leucobacter]PIJ07040.1 hypothetical protein BMH30_14225 [Leucobacter sp. OLES1]PII81562.1 hypothetical protein BMH25_13630 [Leucobacter sp. OLCALW19]PII86234.1 hypothetical protein BMH26_14050 [Leucobacter sp. OLTLW20]PII90129.1 hypothetical protein BMH27_12215 [Leucobacter sp. OLAS13]PII97162.1 hypothetical protein BMH29_12900 [Leucobacter sp. OLDS2]